MAAIVKILFFSLAIICFFHQALGECTLSDISITQSATGGSIHGSTEYEVVVSNSCICGQSSLVVSCEGFRSTLAIDPTIFQQNGSTCTINNGQPIFQNSPIKFNYAWDPQFHFTPVSSQISCS